MTATLPASASSNDAWTTMRLKVSSECLKKANALNLGKVEISVDQFGTQNYGVAVIVKRGAPKQSRLAYVCVMDKKTGEVEVGGEMTLR